LLSFLQPGLGHLYLRAWVRAALWFGLWVTTVLLVVPSPDAAGPVDALVRALTLVADQPLEVTLALVSVTVFGTLDTYWLASRRNYTQDTSEPRCPYCGNEVDTDLEFCHWCTRPIEWKEEAEAYRRRNDESRSPMR
jgi:type III secretory pathway component EscS